MASAAAGARSCLLVPRSNRQDGARTYSSGLQQPAGPNQTQPGRKLLPRNVTDCAEPYRRDSLGRGLMPAVSGMDGKEPRADLACEPLR